MSLSMGAVIVKENQLFNKEDIAIYASKAKSVAKKSKVDACYSLQETSFSLASIRGAIRSSNFPDFTPLEYSCKKL